MANISQIRNAIANNVKLIISKITKESKTKHTKTKYQNRKLKPKCNTITSSLYKTH